MLASRTLRTLTCALAAGLLAHCSSPREESVPDRDDGATKSVPLVRAARRAYDGAPPRIPHDAQSADCVTCHTSTGVAVEGLGFAPPSPHERTSGLGSVSRCRQCHVPIQTERVWVANEFEGRPQSLTRGKRLHPFAPPVMPHAAFMRENCLACHSGPAAREAIRTSHPERGACTQCHVEQKTQRVWVVNEMRDASGEGGQ